MMDFGKMGKASVGFAKAVCPETGIEVTVDVFYGETHLEAMKRALSKLRAKVNNPPVTIRRYGSNVHCGGSGGKS